MEENKDKKITTDIMKDSNVTDSGLSVLDALMLAAAAPDTELKEAYGKITISFAKPVLEALAAEETRLSKDTDASGYIHSEAKVVLPKGIRLGHCNNMETGVTVIISDKGSIAGVDCRGGAPGTRETDLLHNEKMMNKVNAIVLSGGSAYGLEAACGVMEYLCERGIGYKMKSKVVPIVSSAVIYDLKGKGYNFPNKKMGYSACENATNIENRFGCIGAGRGATVGKIRGDKHADTGGVGAATVKINGVTLTAVVVVNAFGDVYNHKTNNIIAGARKNDDSFSDTNGSILRGDIFRLVMGTNTTIGCIITDAKLTKVEVNKLAAIGHNGYAQSIKPVHTDYDGDTLFAITTNKQKVLNFAMLEVGVVEAVSLAIENAVKRERDEEDED